MEWSTALSDWESRIVNGGSMIPCPPLFAKPAEFALKVFKGLRIVDAPGRPTFGEAGDKWVFDFVAAIFGAYDAEAGRRLINEFFLCVAKKNGKSTIAAGIMLTALICNWRHSNELIIVAPTIKAAGNSFKPAADMVRADPELHRFMHVQDHLRQITHLDTKATLSVLAADTSTVAGNKAAFVLIDELWEFGTKANADSMMREAAGGLVTRPEGFIVSITTQSDTSPAGVFDAKLKYARAVRDGRIKDPKFLPVIYEFPQQMLDSEAYLEPDNFYITNPYLGRTSWGVQWIKDELEKEMARGRETRNVFLAKHLNVEIGLGLRTDSWAGAEFWLCNPKTGASNVDKTLTLQEVIRRSEVLVVGVDGGGLDDLLGLAVLGREKDTGKLLLWCHAWAHEIVKQRRKEVAPKLADLAALDQLTFVKLPGDDVDHLAEMVQEVEASGKLAEENSIGVDSFGVAAISKALTGQGIDKERIVGISQGWKLNGAIKDTERDLAGGVIIHPGQELMNFAVGNAKIVPHGNAISIDKQVSGSAKIDPLMAVLHAKVLMGLGPQPKTIPHYELFLVA